MPNPFNEFILVPELVIEKIITQSLIFLRNDYNKQVADYNDETLSWLYILSNNVGMQRVEFFNQAKKIFLAEADDPKRIKIYLQFPQDLKGAVSICITNSGEQHGQNVLSVGETNEIFEEFIPVDEEIPDQTNNWRTTYSRRYNGNYQIICTGDNTNEVLIVYTILKSLLISLEGTGHLNVMGFINCKINGADLQIKQEISKHLYAKTLSLSFEYEFKVPDVRRQQYINGAIFNAIIKES